MAKTDIKSAFRIVPLNPDQYQLMGIKFNGKWYVDLCLAMGASSSCKIFEEISSAMEWVAKEKLNIPFIIHILDDFLIIAKGKRECRAQLDKFLEFCNNVLLNKSLFLLLNLSKNR